MVEVHRDRERLLRNMKRHYIAMRELVQRRVDESKRDKVKFEKARQRVDATDEDGKADETSLAKMISAISDYIKEDEEVLDKYDKKISETDKQMQAIGG